MSDYPSNPGPISDRGTHFFGRWPSQRVEKPLFIDNVMDYSVLSSEMKVREKTRFRRIYGPDRACFFKNKVLFRKYKELLGKRCQPFSSFLPMFRFRHRHLFLRFLPINRANPGRIFFLQPHFPLPVALFF